MFIAYSIKENDLFDERVYPFVTSEIANLRQSVVANQSVHKTEIVISLLKDHCIKTEWLQGNKELARLLTSGSMATSHVESLFGSCKGNPLFRKSLESYIEVQLA